MKSMPADHTGDTDLKVFTAAEKDGDSDEDDIKLTLKSCSPRDSSTNESDDVNAKVEQTVASHEEKPDLD